MGIVYCIVTPKMVSLVRRDRKALRTKRRNVDIREHSRESDSSQLKWRCRVAVNSI